MSAPSGQGVAKSGSHLNNKIKRLLLRIDELQLLIESLKAQGWEQRRRQEILLGLVMKQEQLQQIFKAGLPAFTEGTPQQQQQQQQQQQAREATAPTFNELLASAPAWQVHRCLQMRHSQDWNSLFSEFFRKATPLLELASRAAAVCNGEQSTEQAAAPAAAAPAAAAEPPWSEAVQRCTPDVAAAARQELQTLTIDVVQLSLLAAFFNTPPMRDAVLQNQLTGQLQIPAPEHWQQVAARLQLTPQQIVIMRFVAEALGAAVHQEVQAVNQLCSRATRLSLAAEPGVSSHAAVEAGPAANQEQEQQQQEREQQQPPGASSSSSSASLGAAAAASQDTPVGLMRQLNDTTEANNITIQMLNALGVDCLSPLQIAMAMIAGYPFFSTVYALASGAAALPDQGCVGAQSSPCARLLQQDAEQHMLQRRQQLRQLLHEWKREPKHRQLLVELQLDDAPWLLA